MALCLAACAAPEIERGPIRLVGLPDEASPPPAPAATASARTVESRPLASCGDTPAGFEGWLVSFRQSALDSGISRRTVDASLGAVSYNPSVIELDRSQKAFSMTFEQFYAARVNKARIAQARKELRSNAALFAAIDARFGVPREILVAIWGLETDFGANTGSMSAFRSLATLAYDCRRADRFRAELMSALRIVERGDMTPAEMTGAWAGELGQTQFLASSYETYAIDFDQDGRADLIRSTADALGSTANYLQGHGWRRGEAYTPGKPNFDVLESWNKSAIYRKTIAQFAAKISAR